MIKFFLIVFLLASLKAMILDKGRKAKKCPGRKMQQLQSLRDFYKVPPQKASEAAKRALGVGKREVLFNAT